jgi:hypothetical protein
MQKLILSLITIYILSGCGVNTVSFNKQKFTDLKPIKTESPENFYEQNEEFVNNQLFQDVEYPANNILEDDSDSLIEYSKDLAGTSEKSEKKSNQLFDNTRSRGFIDANRDEVHPPTFCSDRLESIMKQKLETDKERSQSHKLFNLFFWLSIVVLVSSFFLVVLGDIVGGFGTAMVVALLCGLTVLAFSSIQIFLLAPKIEESNRDKKFNRRFIFAKVLFWLMAVLGAASMVIGVVNLFI